MRPISSLDLTGTCGPDGRATLDLAGSLDAATENDVLRAVDALVTEGATTLVIDLTGLRFIDSSGVTALLDAGSALEGRIALRGADDLVGRVITAAVAAVPKA